MDPELLHERVDGEWSFIETLRHLVFATDAPAPESFAVRRCLGVILSEEWEHRLYAERDLELLESGRPDPR